ncbi:MAG: asparagine synthetase, partial [Chitinophagaceae bacterium]|nr:asparagine synthetase [Chitinophagaceae bacterium]
TYSRPLKKGRDIFSATGLQPYGKVWRIGANESTEIKFYTPVTIGGKQLAAGTYTLFAIPNPDNWTIIINSQLDKWGLSYNQFKDKDVMRFEVPVKSLDTVQESVAVTYTPLEGNANGTNIVIGWDKTAVEIPVIFN